MGWVKKVTGDAGRKRAVAAAESEAANTLATSQMQAQALQQNAQQAATQATLMAARSAAESAAADAINKPLEKADVVLDNPATTGVQAARKTRGSFGKSYTTGVSI